MENIGMKIKREAYSGNSAECKGGTLRPALKSLSFKEFYTLCKLGF